MLIVALVLALIGLVALVFAVVTSNELVAWMCIVASVLGVVLLIVDAFRERRRRDAGDDEDGEGRDRVYDSATYDYPEEVPDEGGHDADTGDTAIDESSAEADTDATQESAV